MGSPRFTVRKGGRRMTTVRYAVHVPEDVVEVIAADLKVSKAQALTLLLEQLESEVSTRLGHRYLKTERKLQSKTPTSTEYTILDERELDTVYEDDVDLNDSPEAFEARVVAVNGEDVALNDAFIMRRT